MLNPMSPRRRLPAAGDRDVRVGSGGHGAGHLPASAGASPAAVPRAGARQLSSAASSSSKTASDGRGLRVSGMRANFNEIGDSHLAVRQSLARFGDTFVAMDGHAGYISFNSRWEVPMRT